MAIVICVELAERSKDELDELVQQGSYRNYSEAISVAISNQLILQRRAIEAGGVVLDKDTLTARARQTEATSGPVNSSQKLVGAVPQVFSLADAQRCKSEPAPLPDDVFPKGSKVTPDRWFFGQHNKLLPVKASCRALAVLLAERPLGISVSEAAARIAKEAAALGGYLRQLDSRSGAMREDALATAFPDMSEDSDRSRLRYANQFIASLNAQSQLSGLLVDLKLINQVRGKEPLLLLTEPGFHFAKLQNPILDESVGQNGVPRPRFSDSELEFLTTHIKERVPVENYAFRTILEALTAAHNTPELLDEKLKLLLPTNKRKVSDAFLTTQRSGVIARLSDLDMVTRRRDGVRVRYEVTPRGMAYLNGKAGMQDA